MWLIHIDIWQKPSQYSILKTGCSGQVHWDDPEEWDGDAGGRGVQDGATCTPMADSC